VSIIKVDGLTRRFSYYEKAEGIGASFKNLFHRKTLTKEAVSGVSFTVDEGEIVGFLGPNGAGKTTTLKMLSGIMHPSAGDASVMGFRPWQRKKDFRMRISIVLGQRSQLWPDLPAVEAFELNRTIYELDRAEYRKTLDELVELFGVGSLLGVQVRRLSLGERMKMELIAALLHKPRVLFLDEPTIGLDILSQRAIRDLVRTFNQRYGTTVMLTSHYLSDIEELCERAVLINGGKIVFDGPLKEVNASLGDRKTVKLSFSEPVAEERLRSMEGFRSLEALDATFEVDRPRVKAFSRAALDDLPVADLTIADIPLEEGIASLYRGTPL
jgi:ABC-2 type transport system ATP-binding protein